MASTIDTTMTPEEETLHAMEAAYRAATAEWAANPAECRAELDDRGAENLAVVQMIERASLRAAISVLRAGRQP